ncbi:type III PLP-dependent enzyme [Nonomuraea sp. NPDC050663]|uniref:type III PLP-dependent enzyme n=1 Tax=Nonomuraea sp. NPDC050663 TaxID=3364370 RepID=UPI0037A03778
MTTLQSFERARAHLAEQAPATPVLVLDLHVVAERLNEFTRTFPGVTCYYAVKANPQPEIVELLVRHGASFDVASTAEIDLCLAAGAAPETLSYGNPAKKARDIAYAYSRGVRLFVFDSPQELEKLAEHAPGAQVFCRIAATSAGALWPLGRKFGCPPEQAASLLRKAFDLGLVPVGISFHVGSQQLDPTSWEAPIAAAAQAFADCGLPMRLLNMGGGLPARYQGEQPPMSAYGEAILASVARHFPGFAGELAMEPGRCLVADAGVLRTEIVLVSDERSKDRWIYLDIGRFGGLAETEGEAIRYRVSTALDGGPEGPAVLAGPTCDSADILFERAPYTLPLGLTAGDHVDILSAGAYTTSYASICFNGFTPPAVICLDLD